MTVPLEADTFFLGTAVYGTIKADYGLQNKNNQAENISWQEELII